MARSSLIARTTTTFCLILHFGLLVATHYTDDSDYNDFDYYKDLPEKPRSGGQLQDDFYMVSEVEEPEDRNRRAGVIEAPKNPATGEETNLQGKWPSTERIYRYTKHRIPGYDYDELDFLESRKYHRCDERSVWTHCVCQFTCTEPNIVDCYTPCNSGCECREDYVFDERSQQCVLPEQCQPDDDYLLY